MRTTNFSGIAKICLLFLLVPLLAAAGCGLDVDFGGTKSENENVKANETIVGIIKDVPSQYGGKSFIVKASVIKEGNTQECCRVSSVSEDSRFSLEGNMDPEVLLEIFESENEDSSIGSGRIGVFPGAAIEIEDITVRESGDIDYSRESVDITFNGEISSSSGCTDVDEKLKGKIDVTIASEDKKTLVSVRLSNTEILGQDSPRCSQIPAGRKVEVDGKLTKESNTVQATIIELQ